MISVIIPTFNEQEIITATLSNVLSQQGDFEVIVVDGGSEDRTIECVERFSNVKLLLSRKGRAIQMNTGANNARGDILLFLHADTLLKEEAISTIEVQMQNPTINSGSFFLTFDHHMPLLKVYSFFSKINHPLFTYGDQGIFVRKKIFEQIKGYKALPFMEDVEIQKRLRKEGKFVKLNQAVITSSRRFRTNGILWQQIKNLLFVFSFTLGVSPLWLKKFY